MIPPANVKRFVLFVPSLLWWCAISASTSDEEAPRAAPAQLTSDDIEGTAELGEDRRRLIAIALETGRRYSPLRYQYGSADPETGGFDCSGSMYYVLRKFGLKPPRTSAGQHDWVKAAGNLVAVPEGTTSVEAEAFAKLRPGDLLFWSGTYAPTDGRASKITHVQMYLGKEKRDGRHVMVGASDGRRYRGSQRNGYGAFDFRMPQKESKGRFVGFGRPPGLGTRGGEVRRKGR